MKSTIYSLLAISFAFGSPLGIAQDKNAAAEDAGGGVKVEMYTSMNPKKPVVIELSKKAEVKATVDNFLKYVDDKFYDGTQFHRVIKGFMVQGGGFDKSFVRKSTRQPINIQSNNGLKNTEGTIAMARTNDPNSATSQFFINVANNDFLNYRAPNPAGYGYTVFGKVSQGMEIVKKIEAVKTTAKNGMRDVPENTITITQIRRVK